MEMKFKLFQKMISQVTKLQSIEVTEKESCKPSTNNQYFILFKNAIESLELRNKPKSI